MKTNSEGLTFEEWYHAYGGSDLADDDLAGAGTGENLMTNELTYTLTLTEAVDLVVDHLPLNPRRTAEGRETDALRSYLVADYRSGGASFGSEWRDLVAVSGLDRAHKIVSDARRLIAEDCGSYRVAARVYAAYAESQSEKK